MRLKESCSSLLQRKRLGYACKLGGSLTKSKKGDSASEPEMQRAGRNRPRANAACVPSSVERNGSKACSNKIRERKLKKGRTIKKGVPPRI